MKWNDFDNPWQACFELGWESLKKGSVPIGSVITNEKGEIVSKGRNMIYEENADFQAITRHKMSHAEMNAIIQLSEFDHPNIRKYTIYTTTEPCPMCFGTIVMVNIRNLRFAARDRYAGATELNGLSSYIKSKNMSITGPYKGLEDVQIALHTAYEIKRHINSDVLLDTWRVDSPAAVELGTYLAKHDIINKLVERNEKAAAVFDMVSGMLEGKE